MTTEPPDGNQPAVEYTSLGVGPWYVLVGKRTTGAWTVSVLENDRPVAGFDTIRDGKSAVTLMRPNGKPRAALIGSQSTELILYDEHGQVQQVLSLEGIERALAEADQESSD